MKSSRKRGDEGRVLDVHLPGATRARRFLRRLKAEAVVDLKPTLCRRYSFQIIAGFVLAAAAFVAVRHVLTRAEVADFYAANCLGDWQSPKNAQGKPETAADGVSFDDANSAVFSSRTTRIFCGGFVPPAQEETGEIKNVSMLLVWQVGSSSTGALSNPVAPNTTSTGSATNPTPQEPPLPVSSSPPGSPSTIPDIPPPGALPTSTPSSSSTTPHLLENIFWSFLPSVAEAQSTASDAPPSVSAPPPSPLPSSSSTETQPLAATSSPAAIITLPPPPPGASAEEPAAPTSTPKTTSSPLFAPLVPLPTSSAPTLPDDNTSGVTGTVQTQPPQPDENFLRISYSTDGKTWGEIARVGLTNWQHLTVTLPVASWDDLKKLQIQIEGISTSLALIPKAYLDAMALEVHYDIPPVLVAGSPSQVPVSPGATGVSSQAPAAGETPVIDLPPTSAPVPANPDRDTFRADEAPTFRFDLDNLIVVSSTTTSTSPPAPAPPQDQSSTTSSSTSLHSRGILERAASFFLNMAGKNWEPRAQAQNLAPPDIPTPQNPHVAKVYDPAGQESKIQPILLLAGSELSISIPQPSAGFVPGRYTLKLWMLQSGAIFVTQGSFTWGVLAMNVTKSIYTLGDAVSMGFTVLTDQGHTVCDAALEAVVTAPSGKSIRLSTQNKTIGRNATCGPQTVTNTPDYSATFPAAEAGTYRVSISSRSFYGDRSVEDHFEVQNPPLFDVARDGATRIYPPADYEMTLTVTASQDFTGPVTETVPASFQVTPIKFANIAFQGESQTISWNVSLQKGQTATLSYYFHAPNVSPKLYKLGPLQIGSWAEARQWQVAADAAGDVILFWEGTSADVPAGWTCLNCATTDPFYGVFPRASSTYGTASSSADTKSHSATFVSASNESADSAGTFSSGTSFPASTHTHTWGNFTTSADNIKPPFKNLLFIKANAPTSLPAGIIGMFDIAATSSLPAGWTSYDLLNSSGTTLVYLRGGENTTSTGGSATHQHTVASTITSGAANNTLVAGASNPTKAHAAASHTHTLAAGSVAATATSSNPSFVTIVFGKLSSAGSIPTGLVAFFDNTSLPANWSRITTSTVSGSSFLGNLLVGSSTAGTTGGRNFHTHDNTVITSTADTGGVSDKQTSGGTVGAGSGHTHNVTYSIASSTENSLPVYRDVILGKFTAPANSAPSAANVNVNGSSTITLNPNATQTINVTASTTDPDGNIAYATSTLYRSGVGASCTANNLNCYSIPSSSCIFSAGTSSVTCSANVYYFAQATDASSSFDGQTWGAAVTVTDTSNATGSASTAGVVLNTLLAINVTTSSIAFGSVMPGNDTAGVNQTTTVANAGNASSTLKVSGNDLALGVNTIAVDNEHYATSTFTYGGTEQALSTVATAVSGFLLTAPTGTTAVSQTLYWGMKVLLGKPAGTYAATTTFTAVFSP